MLLVWSLNYLPERPPPLASLHQSLSVSFTCGAIPSWLSHDDGGRGDRRGFIYSTVQGRTCSLGASAPDSLACFIPHQSARNPSSSAKCTQQGKKKDNTATTTMLGQHLSRSSFLVSVPASGGSTRRLDVSICLHFQFNWACSVSERGHGRRRHLITRLLK